MLPPAGTGSQGDLMHKDECVLVDEQDAVLGAASKFDAHRFVPDQPQGRLHRAFSVFLFNAKNELLLQQRAASKLTFPDVWTNTCCSHPLHGHTPSEVDRPEDVASGTVPGAQASPLKPLLRSGCIVVHDCLPNHGNILQNCRLLSCRQHADSQPAMH